ncbi:conserved Plasmodium protein, unknown function [Plasmodium gallinaceum]|uniref:Magnesium transporter n=1 Tax=Plasmodium gallinaceum TaxID=5849 RepID=A0A1J1GQX7_PLAGA|nr:conserved Plasmodium protein, unknown function [Plasmodium gallinaceum]CRG94867.1 conserved Plasmodium protein, unknown function [Plasmodium gallinaceum]
MIKLLIDLIISIILISCINCKIKTISVNKEQTSWMDKPWLDYVGVFLSVSVSIIESVGSTIIKKSHIIYEKYKKLIERKELITCKLEEKNSSNEYNQYSNRNKKGKKKKKSFINISLINIQNSKSIYKKKIKEKKILCNKFFHKKKIKERKKKGDENENENNNVKKEKKRNYFTEGKLIKKKKSEISEWKSMTYIYSKSNRKLRKLCSFQSVCIIKSNNLKEEFNLVKYKNENYNTKNITNNSEIIDINYKNMNESITNYRSKYKNFCSKNLNTREINKKTKRKERSLRSLKNSDYCTLEEMKGFNSFYKDSKENYNYICNSSFKKNKFKNYIKKNKRYNNTHKFYKKNIKKKSFSYDSLLKDFYTLQNRNTRETIMSKNLNFDNSEQLSMCCDNKYNDLHKNKEKEGTIITMLNKKESRENPNIMTNTTNKDKVYYYSFPPQESLDNINSKNYNFTNENINPHSFYISKNIDMKKMYSERKRNSDEEVTRSSTFQTVDENYMNKLKKRSYLYFYCGIFFTSIVAPSFNLFSNALLPASMVGFVSIRLICSLLLERFVLKETQSLYLYIGIPFATIGLILITIFSGKDSQFNDLDYIFKLFLKIESIFLMTFELLFTYSVAFFSIKYLQIKKKKMYNFLYIFSPFSSGIMGSLSTILCKALVIGFMSIIVKDKFRFFQFFLNYKLIILALLTFIVAITEIFYTPYLLKHYHLTHVVSLKSFGNVAFNAVNGMFIFNERPICICAWAFGFFLVLIGIIFLSFESVIPNTINYLKLYFRRSS